MIAQAQHTNRFDETLAAHGVELKRGPLEVLQVNVGRLCNQTCRHCHVNAGPTRTELMSDEVADACIRFLDTTPSIEVLDITGGAPEMSPVFRKLALAGRARGKHVIDRCNLTILSQPGYEDLADFLAENSIHVVASLPCYLAENVDKQRGDGVYDASIHGLQLLNEHGYGVTEGAGIDLQLDLVYNPLGPSLPPDGQKLEDDYRMQLRERFGVRFDRLITITNMPIGRFSSDLKRTDRLENYYGLLMQSFNPSAVQGIMCRTYLSVDYRGYLYDCDFNQMLDLPLGGETPIKITDLTAEDLRALPIHTGDHCLGCTAGCGSSCRGALV